jgi:UrcA family protein
MKIPHGCLAAFSISPRVRMLHMSEQPTQRINKGLPAQKRKNLPMDTPNGVTAAFILASAVLAAPAAFADGPRETIEARFAFDPNDQAAQIYQDLNRTAKRACELNGTRSLNIVKHEQACIREMVQDGVTKLGRADVAAVHNDYFATANAGTRG